MVTKVVQDKCDNKKKIEILYYCYSTISYNHGHVINMTTNCGSNAICINGSFDSFMSYSDPGICSTSTQCPRVIWMANNGVMYYSGHVVSGNYGSRLSFAFQRPAL